MLLETGSGVRIERSNGKKHAATIMQISPEDNQVQVEWQENGDIKAKQVSLNMIFNLNPEYSREEFHNKYFGAEIDEEYENNDENNNHKKYGQVDLSENFQPPVKNIPKRLQKRLAEAKKPIQKADNKNLNKSVHSDRRPLSPRDENSTQSGQNPKEIPKLEVTKPKKSTKSVSSRSNYVENATRDQSTTQANRRVSQAPANDRFGFRQNRTNSRQGSRSNTSSSLTVKHSKTSQKSTSSAASNNNNQPENQVIQEESNMSKSLQSRSNQDMMSDDDMTSEASNQNNNNNKPAASGRKSVVVGKIQQIQEAREKQRAEHAKKRSEQALARKKFGHNPNWRYAEFIEEFREESEPFTPLNSEDRAPTNAQRITVCVRKRPINKKEIDNGEVDCVSVTKKDRLCVHEPKSKVDLTKYLDNQEFSGRGWGIGFIFGIRLADCSLVCFSNLVFQIRLHFR